ncbi:hypothetical protein OB955_18560 [Halobacteria archaeon AArc-m2/3/4]|uniref:DUF7344 domain-containing protein n=1 Tax=Natronoglomus mannanivorans TaxID=2979990 RepID=A0AAP2Z0F8_9EURY|nr:hypothetical protein [Halobacteria archaeon AArc-xg1-1]MCU4974725.1 hypothetical protein [Halobacteria archaeon AArc-m2/3/4]
MSTGNTAIDVEQFARLTGISTDETYRLLANERTRATIRVLVESEQTLPLEHVARAVAERKLADHPDETVRRVRIALVHSTLPRLEAHGLVTYDRNRKQVRVESPNLQLDGPLDTVASPGRSES